MHDESTKASQHGDNSSDTQVDALAASFAEVFRNLHWSYGETTRHVQLAADERAVLHALEKRLYKLIIPNLFKLPPKLYHYTTKVGVDGILSSGGIRATYWRDLADQHEIRYGMALVNETMQFLRSKLDPKLQEFLGALYYAFVQHELKQQYYIACFTECANSERHWKEYGSGFMLEFDTFGLTRPSPGTFLDVQPVIYTIKDQAQLINTVVLDCWSSAMELARNTSGDRASVWLPHVMNLITIHLHWHLSLIKREEFAWEKEWRLIVRSDRPESDQEPSAIKRFSQIPILTKPALSPIATISAHHHQSAHVVGEIVRSNGYTLPEFPL